MDVLCTDFVGPNTIASTREDWNDWANFFTSSPPGGLAEKVGGLTAWLWAPVVLLAKMSQTKEFEQLAIFHAAMRTLVRTKPAGVRMRLSLFWSFLHALRAHWVVPYIVMLNAAFLDETTEVRKILVTVLLVAYLLDLDDQVFQALYGAETTTARAGGSFTMLRVGTRTLDACRLVRSRMMTSACVVQISAMLLIKVHPFMGAIWSIPLLGVALAGCTFGVFPHEHEGHVVLLVEVVYLATILPWVVGMRCIITPTCGLKSVWFLSSNFADSVEMSWVVSMFSGRGDGRGIDV